jgi:tRNA(Ile)-lysidine synthase
MDLLPSLATFLHREAGVRPGDGIVVAFSGGADSTALLHALVRLAPALELRLVAAHLDHGLDPGSPGRATAAALLSQRLGVACRVERRRVPVDRRGGGGLEAEARRVRYDFLEQVRAEHGFRFIATAHHRDDQAETVLLRAEFGSGPLGLAGVQRRRGAVLRPLLDRSRGELQAALVEAGIGWIEDPTNRDPERPRNRIRRALAVSLAEARDAPDLAGRLARVADRAAGARDAVEAALVHALDARREFDGASAELSALQGLPPTLLSPALAALHRQAGVAYPASRRAALELERQIERGGQPACDCGSGWRWVVRGTRLHLERWQRAEPVPVLFTYTLPLPGELEVKELSLRFRLFPSPDLDRVFEVSPRRAVLALPHQLGNRVTVRNRRPGDLIRPLGWDTSCRVKDLLINRKVSRRERYRLPLLASGENVLWIPGIAIDDRCRITPGRQAWIAEIRDSELAAAPGVESQPETLRIAR